jgi:exopolyphosphatase/pppGpp-phosphohydrolase
MMLPDSIESVALSKQPEPTNEELRLSGGLLVEDWPHARQVARLSALLFEATRPLHRMGAKELRLLDRAAFLHNTGMMIAARRHHKHSFRLIKDAQLPDFTEKERYEIACIARYHRRALPSHQHEEFAALSRAARKRVSILAALLRIADALDYSHDGRVLSLSVDPGECTETSWTILLQVRPLADVDVELEHAYEKADLFEKVFARKLHLIVQQ